MPAGRSFCNEADALAAELAASAGDASALAVYGAGIADTLNLEGFPRGRWSSIGRRPPSRGSPSSAPTTTSNSEAGRLV